MNVVKKLSGLMGKCIAGCLFVAIAVLVCVTFMQVMCRFVLKIPVAWSEEVARMSFVWLIFLGAAIAVKEGTHLVLDMVTSMVGPRLRTVMEYWVLLFMLVSSGVIFYAGSNYCMRAIGKTAVTMQIPANAVYMAVPISAALMMFFAFEKIMEKMTGKGKGETQS